MGHMAKPHVVKFHRHRHAQRAVLYDEQLELRSLEDWRDWATRGVDFVILDSEILLPPHLGCLSVAPLPPHARRRAATSSKERDAFDLKSR